MATSAKFPAAPLALVDVGGELPGFPEAVLSGAHNNSVTTITLTATVPTAWPTAGWVTIGTEIIQYAGKSGATLTSCTRGSQSAYGGSAAATHNDQDKVGFYLTPQVVNQIIADLIAVETFLGTGPVSPFQPNLVLNSDFGRRTVFGLAMPEVFADTSAWTAVTGSLGSVASNVLTPGGTGAWIAKHSGFAWSDGRFSTQVKAVDDPNGGGTYNGIGKLVDANNYVMAGFAGGATDQFQIYKRIASVNTQVAFANFGPTLNRFYWVELEAQGTTYIAKLYENTVTGTKAAATLVATISGTVADAAVATGVVALFQDVNSTTAHPFGGPSTSPGGVYVETWLPESFDWTPANVFTGTLGGQAVGYDEVADAGPIGKQWAIRTYIPAATRTINIIQTTADGSIAPSVSYNESVYMKVSGLGGSGTLGRVYVQFATSASAGLGLMTVMNDAGATSWTRSNGGSTVSDATARRAIVRLQANAGATATGTAYFMLPQLEQGSAATAWRNAPADDGSPLTAQVFKSGVTDITTTSVSAVDADSRDLSMDFFAPWDCTLRVEFDAMVLNSAANLDYFDLLLDGTTMSLGGVGPMFFVGVTVGGSGGAIQAHLQAIKKVAAGKHLVKVQWQVGGGTGSIRADGSRQPSLTITATRGK